MLYLIFLFRIIISVFHVRKIYSSFIIITYRFLRSRGKKAYICKTRIRIDWPRIALRKNIYICIYLVRISVQNWL